jgi:hypothetical protein
MMMMASLTTDKAQEEEVEVEVEVGAVVWARRTLLKAARRVKVDWEEDKANTQRRARI